MWRRCLESRHKVFEGGSALHKTSPHNSHIFHEKLNLSNTMFWHDSFRNLLASEETLDSLLKVDNAKSHTPPPLTRIHTDVQYDNEKNKSLDRSMSLLDLDDESSEPLKNLGHFSFPITPRQRTLLLAGEPFQKPKKGRRRPTRSTSFDDAMSSFATKRVPRRRGRRRPDRASSVDDLGKWAGVTPASTRSNVCKPSRRLSNEGRKNVMEDSLNTSLTNVMKPVRRMSNSGGA